MHGGEADEFDDDEGADTEDDAAGFAKDVVEDLRHRLLDGRVEDAVDVAHAEAEDDGEEPADDVGEEHSHGDGPGGFDLGFADLLGDVCGCLVSRQLECLMCKLRLVSTYIVVGHGPANRQEAEEERPACGRPARGIVDVGEDVLGRVLGSAVAWLRESKQRYTGSYDHQSVEDHIAFRHLLHPVGR